MREIPIFKNDFNIRIRRADKNDLGNLINFLIQNGYLINFLTQIGNSLIRLTFDPFSLRSMKWESAIDY